MATYEAAFAAKEKLKEQFWSKNPEKFNVISIGIDEMIDEETDEVIIEEYFVSAYLWDISDATEFPVDIDGVEVKYHPVIEKEEVP